MIVGLNLLYFYRYELEEEIPDNNRARWKADNGHTVFIMLLLSS